MPSCGLSTEMGTCGGGTREVTVQSFWHLIWAFGLCLDNGLAIPLGILRVRTSETQLQPGNRLSFWVI